MTVGACIYCRTTRGPLRREHLIAAGLNGPWVLQKATCATCADITSAVEGHVLGPLLGLARAGLKMRSRRERLAVASLLVDRGDSVFTRVEIPIDGYPAVIQFPEFLPPAHLDGRPYASGIDLHATRTIQVAGPPPEEVARRLGARTIRWTTTFNALSFPRLIAKTAYAFAVADLGLTGIAAADVVPAILGLSDDIGRWVGCDEVETITDPRYLHGVALHLVDGQIIVRVRLFVSARAPEYVVVVGRVAPGIASGRFRPTGPHGTARSRTLDDVLRNAERAPAPFLPPGHAVSVERVPTSRTIAPDGTAEAPAAE